MDMVVNGQETQKVVEDVCKIIRYGTKRKPV